MNARVSVCVTVGLLAVLAGGAWVWGTAAGQIKPGAKAPAAAANDRAEDRGHPVKRHRPVASGAVPVRTALVAAVLLALAALAVAALASLALVAVVAAYLALTTAYTLRLRREPVVEMVVVAAGFVLRGASGGAAAGIGVSSWFLLVAGFGSLFLVSGKRFGEITAPGTSGRRTLATYSPGYLRFVWTGAATLTVVVYLLWADQVYSVRADGTWAFWSLVPFVLAVLRYALEVDRGAAEAPEDVALHDRTLQVLAVVWLVMVAVGAANVG